MNLCQLWRLNFFSAFYKGFIPTPFPILCHSVIPRCSPGTLRASRASAERVPRECRASAEQACARTHPYYTKYVVIKMIRSGRRVVVVTKLDLLFYIMEKMKSVVWYTIYMALPVDDWAEPSQADSAWLGKLGLVLLGSVFSWNTEPSLTKIICTLWADFQVEATKKLNIFYNELINFQNIHFFIC